MIRPRAFLSDRRLALVRLFLRTCPQKANVHTILPALGGTESLSRPTLSPPYSIWVRTQAATEPKTLHSSVTGRRTAKTGDRSEFEPFCQRPGIRGQVRKNRQCLEWSGDSATLIRHVWSDGFNAYEKRNIAVDSALAAPEAGAEGVGGRCCALS
jgi:hypothetical protein